MTLQEALHYGQTHLEYKEIADSRTDAWYLLEHVIEKDRGYYYLHMDEVLAEEKLSSYKKLIKQRGEHIPLQHLTGVQEFMGLLFRVNSHVLIPRQDTECVVEKVLEYLKDGMKVLDMCTGSGCIIISLKANCPGILAAGADVSPEALAVAGANGAYNQTEITWKQSNLFEEIQEHFDVIVSNPPYIASGVIPGLMDEVKKHEPMLALDGGSDGLSFYRKIVEAGWEQLCDTGILVFEIGHDQGVAVSAMMETRGFTDVCVFQDLAGLDRGVIGFKQ